MTDRSIEEVYRLLAERLGLEKDFRCPRCGGGWWGTVNATEVCENDEAVQIIECHGYPDGYGCGWRGTWADIPWPDPSWDSMGLVVKAMRGLHYSFYAQWLENGTCSVEFEGWATLPPGMAEAQDLPEATARAALDALKAGDAQIKEAIS